MEERVSESHDQRRSQCRVHELMSVAHQHVKGHLVALK